MNCAFEYNEIINLQINALWIMINIDEIDKK